MTSSHLLLLAWQVGAVVSFSSAPLAPRHHRALAPSMAAVDIDSAARSSTEPRFEQNSRLMYDDILDAMPWFIRKMVRKNMDGAIAELCDDPDRVTEEDMYAIVTKITPASNLPDSLAVLDRRRTRAAADPEAALDEAADAFFATEDDTEMRFGQTAAPTIETLFEPMRKVTEDAVETLLAPLREMTERKTNDAIADPCEDDVYTCSLIADEEVCFQQNSKLMYDGILAGHPKFVVRQMVQKNLDEAIAATCAGATLTEQDMYDVINAVSPKPLLKFNLSILDEHNSSWQ